MKSLAFNPSFRADCAVLSRLNVGEGTHMMKYAVQVFALYYDAMIQAAREMHGDNSIAKNPRTFKRD